MQETERERERERQRERERVVVVERERERESERETETETERERERERERVAPYMQESLAGQRSSHGLPRMCSRAWQANAPALDCPICAAEPCRASLAAPAAPTRIRS